MNEIEKYLDDVCRTLGGSHDLRQHVREELREHLEEAVEAHVAKGLPRDDAVRKAVEEFGRPEDVGRDLESVYGRRMMSLAIDKAMDWKARNLKTGWKWSFLTSLTILVIIVAQAALVLCLALFIFPLVEEMYATLARALPWYFSVTMRIKFFIQWRGWWLPWAVLGLFIAAWLLFEWRSRSESKPFIRLGVGALLALLTTVVTWWAAFVAVVPMAAAIPEIGWQDLRPATAAAIKNAHAAYAEVQKSVAAKDYDSARDALQSLSGSVDWFARPSAVATLFAMNRFQDFEKVQHAAGDVEAWNASLMLTLGNRPDEASRDLDALSKSWDAFCKEVQCESTDAVLPQPANAPSVQGDFR